VADGAAGPDFKIPRNAFETDRGPLKPGARATPFQQPGPTPRIVGGTPADPADFPGVVGILTWFDDLHGGFRVALCTGTVLSSTKVLTAGHCTVNFPYGYTEVIAGRQTLFDDTAGFVARVATTWTHQGYNFAAQNADPQVAPVDDVSVLTLKDALPTDYTPVTLADQGAADSTAQAATIVGYGVTAATADDPGTLLQASVPIKTDDECSTAFGAAYKPDRMLCAGNPPTTDSCFGDSGGPILDGAVQVGITDFGPQECASSYGVYEALNYYSDIVKADVARSGLVNLDFTGDGHSDLWTRDGAGVLKLFTGSGLASDGKGGFADPGFNLGTGFNVYPKMFRVYNWHGDKTPSIFAKDAGGRLFEWTTDGAGGFTNNGEPTLIGSGWNKFVDIVVTNNWTGNGRPNLMGRTATGDLWLYTSNGSGGWSNPHGTLIGTGWGKFNTVLTPGSWLGNGKQSLIGRTSTGALFLYNSNGQGGWSNPRGTLIGTGWDSFKVFMSPGDWSGDDMIDLIGVRPTGEMRLYTTNGKGAWINGRGTQIASGWSKYNLIF
jgi:hypothetical protein